MSRCCLTVGLFLGLLAPSFQPLTAADSPPVYDPSDVPLAAPAVRQAMQDRNFAEARKAIDEAAKAKDAPSDYLAYLRAWSLDLEKQHDQAIAALEKFEKDFPQSTWLRRARFAKAQAMVAKSDFRGAQAIYEARGQVSALRRAAATIGGRLPGVCRRAIPAPPSKINSPTTRVRGSSMPSPWIPDWRPRSVRKSSSASAIACRS